MLRRYTFKLYPNAAQDAALRDQARMCAVLWNALLEMRETHYRRAKQRGDRKTSLTAFDQGKDITALNAAAKTDPLLAEWRVIPRGTQERVAEMLDLAIKAFFKRAKGGAGAASGYPRYKSMRFAENIPLREPVKSCWKFEAQVSDGGCPSDDFSAKGKREHHLKSGVSVGSGADPRKIGGGDRELEAIYSAKAGADPRKMGGGDRKSSYLPGSALGADPRKKERRLTLRGIPGSIRARGTFPLTPSAMKTADVKFYDGAWWFSVCVEIERARKAGSEKLTVELDLIDSFASVKSANGQCVPGLSDPFSNGRNGEIPCNGLALQGSSCGEPANAGGAQDIEHHAKPACGEPANAGEAQKSLDRLFRGTSCGEPANVDTIQSARDRQYKRGSIRWLREKRRIARIKAKKARQTKEALHRWTTEIVRRSKELSVVAPPVKQLTKSGKGSEQFPGAEVKTIAALNRRVLSMAPASAVQMLEYKAAEAGVACNVERRVDHQISVGGELRAAAVATKRAKRVTKRKQKLLEAAE